MKQQGSKLILTAAAVGATFLATDSSQVKADIVNQNSVRGTSSQQVVQAQTNNGSQAERQKADADRDVGDASREVQKANAAVDSARENLQTARDKQKGATVAVSDAKNDVTVAHNGGVDKAHQAVSNAATDLSDAREEQNQAHNNLNSANEATTEQQKKTDQSQKEYDEAKKNKEQAQKDSKEAHAAVNEQQKYVDGLTEENLNQSKENTQNQLNNNQTAKTDKEKELDQAKQVQQQAKANLAEQQATKEKAEQDVKDAQNQTGLEQAQEELADAKQKQAQAQNDYNGLSKLTISAQQVKVWKKLMVMNPTDPEFENLCDSFFKSIANSNPGWFTTNMWDLKPSDTSQRFQYSEDGLKLTNNQLDELNNFVLDLLNQARTDWQSGTEKVQSTRVDQKIAQEMLDMEMNLLQEAEISNNSETDTGFDYELEYQKGKKQIENKYHVSISNNYSGGLDASVIVNYNYVTWNYLKDVIYGSIVGDTLFPQLFAPEQGSLDFDGQNEFYKAAVNDTLDLLSDRVLNFGTSFDFDGFGFYLIEHNVNGVTPEQTPIKYFKQSSDYKATLDLANQQVKASQAKVDAFYAKAPVTRAKTLDLATAQANLAKATQAVNVAQKQVNDISSQVTKLTTKVSQLDKQIKNDQAKVAEIEDTLANLPEKQAEAQQKLAELKADSALKDETLKITQNELQEKEATLATVKEQLAVVTATQADAQLIADQADQDVISLEADLQDAQAYQYRMEHADELLSVAQAQLTMAEQAVTDAENELVSVTSNQAQAQQKLSQAKEKQKQAQKNYDSLMSASHAKQSEVNGADVITLSHQTVVLPSNQKSNSDKVVLPETGVKKDAPAFGVLGLLLVSLGLGGFAKSKNRRRRA